MPALDQSKRWALTLVLMAALALFVAACGDDDDDDGGGATATSEETASNETAEATGEPFKVMLIGGFEGATANANPEIEFGAQAAADAINARGGLNGRPIEIEICSHQDTTEGDNQCARRAVQQNFDNVIHRSSYAAGAHQILDQAGIPQVGIVETLLSDRQAPNAYPVVRSSQLLFIGPMAYAAQNGDAQSIAGMGVENDGSKQTVEVDAKRIAEENDLEYLGAQIVAVDEVDYLPSAQVFADEEADIVVCSCPVPGHVSMIGAFQQLGYSPSGGYVTNGPTLTPGVIAETPGAPDPTYAGSELPPVSAEDNEFVQAFMADMEAAGYADDPSNLSLVAEVGYADVIALEKLAERTDGEFTKESMVKTVETVTADNPIDMLGAFNWTPGDPGPSEYPNDSNGWVYVSQWDAESEQYVLAEDEPVDTFAALGIGESPPLP